MIHSADMFCWVLATTLLACAGSSSAADAARHVIVFHDAGKFAGWPANGGLWSWDGGMEALVGFEVGKLVEKKGHNISPEHENALARSRDGGETWTLEPLPPGYYSPKVKPKPLLERIDFAAPGLALRVLGEGCGSGGDGTGALAYSTDRGKTWAGPFALAGMNATPELKGYEEITARTDYLSAGSSDCLLMMSARPPGTGKVDRVFAAQLTDGGRKIAFTGWVVPPSDPARGVMPSTVRIGNDHLVTAVRRRTSNSKCWIEAYRSADNGKTWASLGKVGDTGRENGNPPALVRMKDGRLCCAFGDRTRAAMVAKLSKDDGATWGEAIVLRDDYLKDKFGDADLGYPRMMQRPDGKLVTIYYWADAAHSAQHIAATIWSPPEQH